MDEMAKKYFEIRKAGDIDKDVLETFDYEYQGREIELTIDTDEFTSVCPRSGLPDFAKIIIKYVPDRKCIELKSLKYYFLSYRNVGMFYEHIVNRMLQDLVEVCRPVRMNITGDFKTRGGLHTTVEASYERGKKRKS
ncbi:MAG: preQ(1) synthase [Fidelibacterota bacterium]